MQTDYTAKIKGMILKSQNGKFKNIYINQLFLLFN